MFHFFQKIIAWFLIGLLFFEATFRVPFLLPSADALEAQNHEDVVSLLVEEELFRKIPKEIDQYARRIQAQLPRTRTVILTFARDAHPFLVASANERLYFSGVPAHGTKTQKLVGTVLIGRVPLPVVHKDGKDFFSLYPYVDFSDPHFFWNWQTNRYEYIGNKPKNPNPDVWHSVIDPNTGNIDEDAKKIRDFFTRVYEFDEKKGRYADLGKDPQVLYMDSNAESKAASKGLMGVYEKLYLPQQEHLVYHRFTRKLAQYFYDNYLSLMNSRGTSRVLPFSEWKPTNTQSSFLSTAGDISTVVFAQELVVPFLKVINEKYLGDISRWVHNTGRYYNGYSDVRVDTIPELITKKDQLTSQVLKELNDTIEKVIDTYVDQNMAMDIPLLIERKGQKTISERQTYTSGGRTLTRQVSRNFSYTYDNYFYGTKASDITSASQCSLVRGSTFAGNSTRVEMNHAYSMTDAQEDSKKLNADIAAGIVCKNPTQSYWGGNSPINTEYKDGNISLGSHRNDDFSQPILDLGSGKNTTLPLGSPLDCLKRDLLLKPYKHTGIDGKTVYPWPEETGGERYSCITAFNTITPYPVNLDPSPEGNENIFSSLVACPPAPNSSSVVSILDRKGSPFITCQTNGLTGTYKKISSLIKHSDPSTEIYGQQLKSLSTPNLPIDEERYLSFLNRDAKESKITYPNLFDVVVNPRDTDDIIAAKISALLSVTNASLVPGKTFPENNPWKNFITSAEKAPTLSEVIFANPEIKKGLIDALRWRSLDIESKYTHALQIALSDDTSSKLIIPQKKSLYEIAYLGGQGDARNFVFGFSPEGESETPDWFRDIQSAHEGYTSLGKPVVLDNASEFSLSPTEIATLLGGVSGGTSSGGEGGNEGGEASTEGEGESTFECGDPEGVVIWEWLDAIQCWLADLFNTEWFTPDIDDIGFPEMPSISVGLNGKLIWTTKELADVDNRDANNNGVIDYIENNTKTLSLTNTLSDTVIEQNTTIRIDTALENSTNLIDDDRSRVDIVITNIDDLETGKKYSENDANWDDVVDEYVSLSGSPTLKDGHVSWTFQAKNNHRARVYIESRIYSRDQIFLRSERSIILIGPKTIPLTVVSSSGEASGQTIRAGDTNGIQLLLGQTEPALSTVNIEIFDYVTSKKYVTLPNVSVQNNRIQLSARDLASLITRAGRYTISATSDALAGETRFTIAPAAPHHVVAQMSSLLVQDKTHTMDISVRDIFENSVNLTGWNIKMSTNVPVVLNGFGEESKTQFEGKIPGNILNFIPKSSGNVTFDITMTQENVSLKQVVSRPILSDVRLVIDIPQKDTLTVGKETEVSLSVQRQDGSVVETWDMPLTLGVRGGNAAIKNTAITFTKGRGKTILNTGTQAGTLQFYMSDTVLGSMIGDTFTILPGLPAQLTVSAPETLHANTASTASLVFQLRDMYGNLTDLGGHTWFFEIDRAELTNRISTPIQKEKGIFATSLTSTGLPGRVLVRFGLMKDGKKSAVKTLENAFQVNILPVITSEEVANNSWNSVTQILLGGIFGQTAIQGYFGGSALFSPKTKTLAISTLVDQPHSSAFTVTPSGNIIPGAIQYGTGMGVRIQSINNGILSLDIADERLGSIARVTYPALGNDFSYDLCNYPEHDSRCDKNILTFVSANPAITYQNQGVYQNNQFLFNIQDIFRLPNLQLRYIPQDGRYLQFMVYQNEALLGILALRFKSRVPNQPNNPNTYQIQIQNATINTQLNWTQTSSYDVPSVIGYAAGDTAYIGGVNEGGWSNYGRVNGLGWTGNNVSLLQFASGQEWSLAQKDSSDYLTINLGDPLIRLPSYGVHAVTGFDQTIGEPVYIGSDAAESMTFRDVNSDGNKDLIVFHEDGTIGTRINNGQGAILDIGDLLHIPNARNGMIRSGDFVGDGYADVVFVDPEGILRLVLHTSEGPTEAPFNFDVRPNLGTIEQLEVFDMDNDAIDDVIVLDSIGNLYIFYGTKKGIFTAQFIENAYDFSLGKEPKASYFTGAIRYDGPGYQDPARMRKSSDVLIQSKQDLIDQSLFTTISFSTTAPADTNTTAPASLGTTIYDSLDTDGTGFLRMYDGDAKALGERLRTGFDALQKEQGENIRILGKTNTSNSNISLLKAPFVNQKNLLITKKYNSQEAGDTLIAASPIEVTLSLKNNSKTPIRNIILLEKFPRFLQIQNMSYTVSQGTTKETKQFIPQGDGGVADLRQTVIAPGQTLTLTYSGQLQSFSFGRFDVGYLEDKNDPNLGSTLPKEKIRTINATAEKLSTIPERDFYNYDVFGDIRFNPNETCGGPLLLWRSHNKYDRTYHKTVIVRDIQDPDKNAAQTGAESLMDGTNTTGTNTSNSSSSSATPSLQELQSDSISDLATWQADADGDSIPDRGDDDHGEVFEINTSGNTTQISIGLGKVDDVLDDIIDGVKSILSGLSCGFGDPGCISMPINWAANVPGNTLTALGFAIPGANQPPIACHADVRCGYPIFATPTEACAECEYECTTWPPCSEGAGGAFDYHGGSGTQYATTGSKTIGSFTGGDGISTFRLFIGVTLTGAIAEVMCFGPNTKDNLSINVPGLFPVVFVGNCVFATQPLTQCEDDGADEAPLLTEMDIASEINSDNNGNGDGTNGNGNNGNGNNSFTNADGCGFYEPVTAYPTDLAESASRYLTQNDASATEQLHSALADNTDLITNAENNTDSGLYITTGSPDDSFSRLNGVRGLRFDNSQSGTGMIQISIDASKLNIKDFGKVLDINLRSIKGFPNFIIDWYHRQLDEIVSSLGHLPDIKIYLPDLSSLADSGWISSFGSGLKQQGENLLGINDAPQDPNTGLPVEQTANVNSADLTLQQNNAINQAMKVPTNYDCLQCGEFANNYIEQLTGVSQGPIRDSYSSKQDLANSKTPVAGSVAIMPSVGSYSQYGHTAVVTKVNNNGTVDLVEANYSSPGVISTRRNVSTSEIYGYHVPSSSSTSQYSSLPPSTSPCAGGACSINNRPTTTSTGSQQTNSSSLQQAGSAIKNGWNSSFETINSGLDYVGTGLENTLGYIDNAKNEAVGFVQEKTTGIRNAFEYIGTLPIIDVHPETINFEIPWVGKQEAQAWILRNEAILEAWRNLPADAANSVDVTGLIASIEANIEIVRSYMDLPEKLQNLFYIKEKILYGIVQNVKAVQDLLGGWLYNNGLRFKAWVEVFILVTKLWELWQILIDVFDDYEAECGVCRNERWNLQHWLWLIISMIIPPIPVIEMPRWPDIELDLSDIDLSLDIAYPVFNLSFYPVNLPDAPIPTISGFPVGGIPLLPRLPNLDIDINIPVIQLPNLPDLPPPPKIPELSQAIQIVLKIFKIIVLIQCLYRKIPLSPEWNVGTHVAHKTERQGFLSFDFLDYRLPTVSMEWLDAIRVSTHVNLRYDVDYITEMLRSALEPFNNFPRNLDALTGGDGTPTVDFYINPEDGVKVDTSASIQQLPALIASLYSPDIAPSVSALEAQQKLASLDLGTPSQTQKLANILAPVDASLLANIDHITSGFQKRFDTIQRALEADIAKNKEQIADIGLWKEGKKRPEQIAVIGSKLPGIQLTQSQETKPKLLALEPSILNPLPNIIQNTQNQILPNLGVVPTPVPAAVDPSQQNAFADKAPDTTNRTRTRGLYVTNNTTSQRLIDYTEALDGSTQLYAIDDDGDGDQDVYYSLGNRIYRKENYKKTPKKLFITDAPQVFDITTIYREFFGLLVRDLESIPGDAQVDLLRSHTNARINYRYLTRNVDTHQRLLFFRSLFQRDPRDAKHVVDIIPAGEKGPFTRHTLLPVPYVAEVSGKPVIQHNQVYRTLLTNRKFRNSEGKVENLSNDFIIRSGQAGYAPETTVVEAHNNGVVTRYTLRRGQKIVFAGDTWVDVLKGSLILFSTVSEKRTLTPRDVGLPLLIEDEIFTNDTGSVAIQFADGIQTRLTPRQQWRFQEYEAASGIKTGSLPIDEKWYYVSSEDAHSLPGSRLPDQTLFNAYSRSTTQTTVSQIPREISLVLDRPTQIDFQKYFPADTITAIEVLRLPASEWRRINASTVAFEMQKEKREITLRITTNGSIRDYTTTLITRPPTLGISQVTTSGAVTGTLSDSVETTLGIQSFIGTKTWTIAPPFSPKGTTFATQINPTPATLELSYGTQSPLTINRTTGALENSAGFTTRPIIALGKPLTYSISHTSGERAQISYQGEKIVYSQIYKTDTPSRPGIYVSGDGLRMEPASLSDTRLAGGVYITDLTYRPLVALDSRGTIAFIDSSVVWSVVTEPSGVSFVLSRSQKELGRILIRGDMVTTWAGK